MKLTDVAHTNMGKNDPRITCNIAPARRSTNPTDPEKDALVAAIKAGTTYAVVVVTLSVSGEPLASMTAFADSLRRLRMQDSFAGFAIIGPSTADASSGSGTDVLVCRILFRAIGSFAAASVREPSAQSYSRAIEFYDDFVEVHAKFVARIDEFCKDALCIAAAGSHGMIPLWVPMTYVPS